MDSELRLEWGAGGVPPEFSAAEYASDREPPGADAAWGLARDGSGVAARLATYVRRELSGVQGTSGLIGHYDARDAAAGVALLQDAVARLRAQGVQRVLGPMNGSTWRRYRLVLPSGGSAPAEPPFIGEPVNPDRYAEDFHRAGFRAAAMYESRISHDLGRANPHAGAGETAIAARGISVAPLDLARFEEELRDLHALSVRAFPENRYYSPIDADTFAALYRPMRDLLDPELVLLARSETGELVAYAFAYVDPTATREGWPYRLIVKTLATHPDWRSMGLGGVLVERLHAAARRRKLGAIVHALMHVANDSVKISAHTATVFRRYALFEHSASDDA